MKANREGNMFKFSPSAIFNLYKNTIFRYLKKKNKQPNSQPQGQFYKKYILKTNTCTSFPVSSEYLALSYFLHSETRLSFQFVYCNTDSEIYHRNVLIEKQLLDSKCDESPSMVSAVSRTSMLSAAVCHLSVWMVRSQTSLQWTSHKPSWSPACRTEGRSGRCFHSAWKSSGNDLWHGCTLRGSRGNKITLEINFLKLHLWHR